MQKDSITQNNFSFLLSNLEKKESNILTNTFIDIEKIDKGGFRNVGISSADEKQKIRVLQEEINGLRRAQLEQNAKMKSGSGAAPNVNINAPSDNKVTNSTSNTTSSNTTISNPDPIVQMAMT